MSKLGMPKAKGVTIGRIGYADYGLDVYGSGFATRDALIEKEPEMVRAFLKAAYRGYADAARDPKATAKDKQAVLDAKGDPAHRALAWDFMQDLTLNKTLLLVDGSSYLFRAYHALPDLRGPEAFPTGAIHGMVAMMKWLRNQVGAGHAA